MVIIAVGARDRGGEMRLAFLVAMVVTVLSLLLSAGGAPAATPAPATPAPGATPPPRVSPPTPVAGTPAPTAPAKPFEFKVSTFVAPKHHLNVNAVERWGNEVEKQSGGRIKFTYYHAQALGRSADHYDMAAKGVAEVVLFVPGYTAGRFPLSSVGELAFLHPPAPMGS